MALNCLLAGERQGAWSDDYLRKEMRRVALDNRDAGLCARLTYGVLQNRMLLDWHIARLSSIPLAKLESVVLSSLRLGAYQLLFLDRVPSHAAVNSAVDLTKKYSKNPRSGGLVNAILRNLEREKGNALPEPDDISTQYSHPAWLVEAFSKLIPAEELPELLKANNEQPPIYAQVNTCKYTKENVIALLEDDGISSQPHPWLANCLLLSGTGNLQESAAFQKGAFYIQDPAAYLAVMAAAPEPGMTVLDACAAPGGKSFAAALSMKDRGYILSCDIHPHKEKLIQNGAKRLGVNSIETAVMDGKVFEPEWEKHFDLVVADVPCSGLGIIRKKPDIRYKEYGTLSALPKVQSKILQNVARYVKSGGSLLYATCTLLKEENQDVIEAFLQETTDFSLEGFVLPGLGPVPEGMLTLWPHIHGTDGFFFAKLRRK